MCMNYINTIITDSTLDKELINLLNKTDTKVI